jgi:hypothetical protein
MARNRTALLVCALGLWGCGPMPPAGVQTTFHSDALLPPASGLADYRLGVGDTVPLWGRIDRVALNALSRPTADLPAPVVATAVRPPWFPAPVPPLWCPPAWSPYATPFYTAFLPPPVLYSPPAALSPVPPADWLAPGISPFATFGVPGFWPIPFY